MKKHWWLLLALALGFMPDDPGSGSGRSIPQLAFGSMELLVLLILTAQFLTALQKHASGAGAESLAVGSGRGLRLYFAVSAVTLIASPFMIQMSASAAGHVNFILALMGVSAALVVFFLCRTAARELGTG